MKIMCGIVAYVGGRPACDILLSGLKRMEHRGYDSAGMAVLNQGRIERSRTVGQVSDLMAGIGSQTTAPQGCLGIAHTRWATHGTTEPRNAHPHFDASGRIALVHNGIIENHARVRSFLEKQDIRFHSETDSEVLVQLIGFRYVQTGDLLESVRRALADVQGTLGIAVICRDLPNTLIAARRGSPLIVGVGQNEFFVSSETSTLVHHTSQVVFLDDNEIVCLGPQGMQVTTVDADPVEKQLDTIDDDFGNSTPGDHSHHMLKEIMGQPDSLRDAARGRIDLAGTRVNFGGLASCFRELARSQRMLLFGCGTSWHAGLVAEYLFEEFASMPTSVEYSSELRYRNPLIEAGTLAIAISQSGETPDTIAAMREVRMRGATALGVVNTVGSTLARESDAGVYLHIGSEIGVASTKAFTAQLEILALIAVDLGRRRHLSTERAAAILHELDSIPAKVESICATTDLIRDLANEIADCDNWLCLGRGVNFPVALECALKLKEVSRIHAEGLPAAEMKHGPIAMIDPGMPVIVIAIRDHTHDRVLNNIDEVRSRGGRVIAVATEGDVEVARRSDHVIYVPRTLGHLSPMLTVIPLQLLAYHTAVLRGRNVDRRVQAVLN